MNPQEKKYLLLGWRIVGEFGAILAVPVVALAWLGKWLDTRYGTRPLFLIIGFASAAGLSAVSIYRRAKQFAREYQAIIADEKKSK